MTLRPRRSNDAPGYPSLRRAVTARKVLRRVAAALLASSAVLMAACPGVMASPYAPASDIAAPAMGGYASPCDKITALGLGLDACRGDAPRGALAAPAPKTLEDPKPRPPLDKL